MPIRFADPNLTGSGQLDRIRFSYRIGFYNSEHIYVGEASMSMRVADPNLNGSDQLDQVYFSIGSDFTILNTYMWEKPECQLRLRIRI